MLVINVQTHPKIFALVFLIIFLPFSLIAKDFGTHGIVKEIEEKDPIVLIQQKLKGMEERGELDQHYKELQKKAKAGIERPKPVEGLTKTQKTRLFTYDPTYVVKEDIKDHTGRIIHAKGKRINPLETVSLSQSLLFFDGDDPEQKAFAQEKLKSGPLKLILVKGAPLALSEDWKIPVYFDQGGFLTKKFGIRQVPARVTQEGRHLRVEELSMEEG